MKFLITAGPTREPIDPVRFLSNRSSGKMGYALAEAAAAAGHAVDLVSGPVCLDVPPGVMIHRVETAAEMFEKVRRLCAGSTHPDAAIHAAAVADYRPKVVATGKVKKDRAELSLELELTPDVLGSMRPVFHFEGCLVGFAAETENLVPNAQEKLRRKGCDLVVANDVSRNDIGFDSEDNEVTLCFSHGATETLPRQSKRALASALVVRVAELARDRLNRAR